LSGLLVALVARDPLLAQTHRRPREHTLQQRLGLAGDEQHPPVLLGEKAILHRAIDPGQQRIEIAGDVEQSHRPSVNAQLRPGEDLEQFVGRAKASR
jgi:hypothetical protein